MKLDKLISDIDSFHINLGMSYLSKSNFSRLRKCFNVIVLICFFLAYVLYLLGSFSATSFHNEVDRLASAIVLLFASIVLFIEMLCLSRKKKFVELVAWCRSLESKTVFEMPPQRRWFSKYNLICSKYLR